ncbi:MAG: peptide chain release factor 1 [Bacteroidia bacterium]|nr:peptide chain release factor 1 [Bacteroidia bacterium]
MLDKLQSIAERYKQIEEQLSDPATLANMKLFATLNKEYKELGAIYKVYTEYKDVAANLQSAKDILYREEDEEMKELAKSEVESLTARQNALDEELKILLVPKDPEDSKDAVMEIRAGTGGDEASLFAGDLFRMYTYYCEKKGWKMELLNHSEGTAGGFKEIIFEVKGEGVYGTLKYESGVHRVQRVPKTETQGRVHTSAATVIVMPEADEVDVDIKESDIRKDTFCAGGHGGQSVNTTYSAVRLTHIPTGMVVQCQDERSQLKNYNKALAVLRTRLYEIQLEKKNSAEAAKRKSLVATGDRSEKIRTYNFPQSRITDHRIGFTAHNLQMFLSGEIEELIDALKIAENTERLKENYEVTK